MGNDVNKADLNFRSEFRTAPQNVGGLTSLNNYNNLSVSNTSSLSNTSNNISHTNIQNKVISDKQYPPYNPNLNTQPYSQ